MEEQDTPTPPFNPTPNNTIPIASLDLNHPTTENTFIKAIVTLIWPFSSSTRSTALLAVEPDFRLRSKNGQVRIQFEGPAASAIAASGIANGDIILLCLDGSRFVENRGAATIQTPGRCVDGELLYKLKLRLLIERNGQPLAKLYVDEPPSPSPIRAATPVRQLAPAAELSPLRRVHSPDLWSSPAFATPARFAAGSHLGLFHDALVDKNGIPEGQRSKRLKLWDWNREWDLDLDLDSGSMMGEELEKTTQPPQTPPVRPLQLPAIVTQSEAGGVLRPSESMPLERLESPMSSRLVPLLSAGLPLISPFPSSPRQSSPFHFEPRLAGGIPVEKKSGALPSEDDEAIITPPFAAFDDVDLYSASPRVKARLIQPPQEIENIQDMSTMENMQSQSDSFQSVFEALVEHDDILQISKAPSTEPVNVTEAGDTAMDTPLEQDMLVDFTGGLPSSEPQHDSSRSGLMPPTPQASQVVFSESQESSHDRQENNLDYSVKMPPTPLLTQEPSRASAIDTMTTRDEVVDELVVGARDELSRQSLIRKHNDVPNAISPWFTSRRTGQTQATRAEQEQIIDSIPSQDDAKSINMAVQKSFDEPLTNQNLAAYRNGFRTSLSYYTPLSAMRHYLNIPPTPTGPAVVDVLVVATSNTTKTAQAKAGPRDYFVTLHVCDMTSFPNRTQVQVFRPWTKHLPRASKGDVVLLRNFVVKSAKGNRIFLLSAEASAWCVWHFEEELDSQEPPVKANPAALSARINEECRGAPVEIGDEERMHAKALASWWRSMRHNSPPGSPKKNVSEMATNLPFARVDECVTQSEVSVN